MSNKKVAAIVPALNEEKNVEGVLKVLLEFSIINEVILVDDGSLDKTAEIGERLGVKVVKIPETNGKGNAMLQGSKATTAEILIFFDADLNGLTEKHIFSLLDPMLKENIAMCVGVRERMFNLPSLIIKIDPLLAIGGERAIKRSLIENLSEKLIKGFSIEVSLNHYCIVNKLLVKHVTLKNLNHITKEKKWGVMTGFTQRIKMVIQITKMRLFIIFNKKNLNV
jgi:hypothetical protein